MTFIVDFTPDTSVMSSPRARVILVVVVMAALICVAYVIGFGSNSGRSSRKSPIREIHPALASLKQRAAHQKKLRSEYFKMLGTQLDEKQEAQIKKIEREIEIFQKHGKEGGTTFKTPELLVEALPAMEDFVPKKQQKTISSSKLPQDPPAVDAPGDKTDEPEVAPPAPAPTAPPAPKPKDSPAGPVHAAATKPQQALLHRSTVSGTNAVVGFAAYDRNILGLFRSFVMPLRASGYTGHIILGCRRNLDPNELEFLKKEKVTMYAIDLVQCDLPWMKTDTSKKEFTSESERIRGVCVKEYPQLKMEWARFQLGADWLATGEPFKILDRYKNKYDLMLSEEWYGTPHGMSNEHWFTWASMHACYGPDEGEKIVLPYKKKPVVCSGTVMGNRAGITRYAKVMTSHFYELIKLGEKCVAPKVVDQAVQIRLYYEGRFGKRATALKYGEGPVLTVGGACANATHHSMTDVLKHDKEGFVLNNDGTRAPIVHQYDRCHENFAPFVMDVDRFVKALKKPKNSQPSAPVTTPIHVEPVAPAAPAASAAPPNSPASKKSRLWSP